MRRFMRRMFRLGVLAAIGYALWRAYDRRKVDTGVTWDAQPFPYPPQPHSEPTTVHVAPEAPAEVAPPVEAEPTPAPAWIVAEAGLCPSSHPVKAKLASGIFHLPGGMNYTRTKADRCYASPEAAEADGLRAAKR